jgi:signal peptidase II
MKFWRYFGIVLLVIVLDQAVKMAVFNNMVLGPAGEIKILGDWFKLHYTLNSGMAFGLELAGNYGKMILTMFRLVAMGGIAYYLVYLVNHHAKPGLLICLSLILGGAIGNIVDSIFYGQFLGLTSPGAPTPWFHGKVVDMFYFHFWEGIVPDWIPVFGGEYTSLWPIFNVADASIFCGIVTALIFQNQFFQQDGHKPKVENKAVESSAV